MYKCAERIMINFLTYANENDVVMDCLQTNKLLSMIPS